MVEMQPALLSAVAAAAAREVHCLAPPPEVGD